MSKKKVLLVDDSAEIRRAVRPLFDSHPKFQVVGKAEHGREAVEKAPKQSEIKKGEYVRGEPHESVPEPCLGRGDSSMGSVQLIQTDFGNQYLILQ